MKKHILSLLGTLLFAGTFLAQNINISDPDFGPTNPINCANYQDGGAQNFFDNGGTGNYPANSNETITICPNLPNGPKITAVFGTNTGFTFDIHPSDTLYVYDGPTTAAPLLGAHNSATDPNGFTHNASFENNPSGCLTFVFVSDGANQGSGWAGGITCGNPPQPFYPLLEAFINGNPINVMNPIDTGYIDVCLFDTVMIVAKPLFPYSLQNTGMGYSQTLTNINYNWNIANTPMNVNNDTIVYIPQTRNGFYVSLKMTDIFPQMVQTFCKIRVSQLPSFAGTGPLSDVICINETTELVGGANATDTIGVAFPPGAFILGGTVAGLTPLPDGSGQNYTTTITMTDFGPGAVFSSPGDLENVCLTMEHSFLGDLEMWLTCPNGQQATLINAYNPGQIPGGFGGGGTFLGDANDTGNGTPGIGFEYCFSSVNATWGSFPTEFAAGNTIPVNSFAPPAGNAMNPNGVYLPETNFSVFNGCPLNGNWTITVRDNLSIDDGYIFQWGLQFDAGLFPNNENYTNSLIDEYWINDPSIIGGVNDTAIVVLPPGPGVHNYTFVVEDNYGCFYDTTVTVTVKQPIILNLPDTICTLTYTTTLNTGTNDGVWSFYNSAGTPTFSVNDVNTSITFPSFGLYNLVYSDTSCTDKDTATILVEQSPFFNFDSDFFTCSPFDAEYLYFADSNLVQSYSWGLVNPAEDTLFTANLYPGGGIYTASYVSNFGCERDTTFTITTRPDNVIPNYGLVCGTTLEMNQNTGLNGGTWTSPNGNGNVSFSPTNTIITTVTVTAPGTYTLVYTDECGTDQVNVEFNQGPSLQVSDGITCVGETFNPTVINVLPNTNYLWNTGEISTSITVDAPGDYVVVATNSCGSVADTVTLQMIPCVIDVPNVFTPNGDGFNDTFGMIDAQGLLNFKCTILNRWGNVVRDFDDPAFEWDGTDKNGTQVTEGVYFYIINTANILGDQIEKQGSVTLIRN